MKTAPDVVLLRAARELVSSGVRRSPWAAVTSLRFPGYAPRLVPSPRPCDLQRLWERYADVLEGPKPAGSSYVRSDVLSAFDLAVDRADAVGRKANMTTETAPTATEQPKTRTEAPAARQPAVPATDPRPMPASPTPGIARRTELGLVVMEVRIEDLEKGPGRNVRELDAKSLDELTASVKQHGVLEPVLIREAGPRSWELVSGFRRTAAAKAAGLKVIPARVLDLTSANVAEVQLTENLQREDLSEIEEARAFKAYLDAGHTQQQLAARIGKSQPYVANRIGLLMLPAPVQRLVDQGELSASHAEVLRKIPSNVDPKQIARIATEAVKGETSVSDLNRHVSRQVEELRRREKFVESLKSVKFPKCPTCHATATGVDYSRRLEHGNYNDAHHWSGFTGQTEAQYTSEEQRRYMSRSSRTSSRPRPKPADCRESPLLRSGHDPMTIVHAILKDAGAAGIEMIEYDERGDGKAVLRVGLASRPLGDIHVVARPVQYSSGERTQFVVQDPKAPERKASKSKIQSWERRALAAPRLKAGKPVTFDAVQLKGTAGLVASRLSKFRSNPEMLELARQLEASGKHRSAVLDYIDEQLLGRGHDSYRSSLYERRL